MTRVRKVYLLSVLVASFLLFGSTSSGQVVSGSISGSVVDSSGARVPGASVSITNRENGTTTQATTSDAGFFRFTLLAIGSYDLVVLKSGFERVDVGGIKVDANAEYSTGELRLQLGSQTSTVEVSAPPPLVEATQAQVTSDITGETLATYAGVAENQGLDMMALQVPGVVNTRDNNFSNTNGVGFSVNGLRGRSNDEQIDGQNNNDNSVTGPGIFLANIDFVQEYQITTSNFGPEYGRNSGSVVNLNTKSGSNTWHGDLGGTETNSYLTTLSNQEKFFEGLTKPPHSNQEFTDATIGGALKKDKIFVFGGFDDELEPSTGVFNSENLTPTPAGVAALAVCFPGSTSIQALQAYGPFAIKGGNPVVPAGTTETLYTDNAPVNNTTDPVNGSPACGYQLGGIQRVLPNGSSEYDWIARTDLEVSSKDAVFVRFLSQRLNSLNVDGSGAEGYPVSVPSLSRSILGQWTHIFSNNVVNEFRVGYSNLNVQFGGNTIGNTVPVDTNISSALGSIAFADPTLLGFGVNPDFPEGRDVKTWQIQDNFDITRGRHQLKAGVNFTYQNSPNTFLPNYNGSYIFADWVAYAENIPASVSITEGTPAFTFKEYDTFWYVGDNWKIKDNLTLNLGLTYSFFGQPANVLNQITMAQQKSSTPFWDPTLPLSVTTDPKLPAIKDLFGPSVGFAWSPRGRLFGQDKTVIRGGYRLTSDPVFYNPYLDAHIAAPAVLAQTLTAPSSGVPSSPTGANVRSEYASSLTLGVFDPRNFNRTILAPHLGPDRVQEWSLGLQRQVSTRVAVEARYVGNHGMSLLQSINQNPYIAGLAASYPNLVPSGDTPCTTPLASVPNALGTLNCSEGNTRQFGNTGFSNYNALQTELRTTGLFNQLTLKMGYTYSKTMDNVSEIFSTFGGGNSIAYSQNTLNYTGQEYSLSGLDTPNVWTVNFVEEIPFMKSQQGLLGRLIGGWAISGNYTIASGEPFTPSQEFVNYFSGGVANDTNFDLAHIGTFETSRPFIGNPSAPATQVGIYAADACGAFNVGCADAPNNLISLNAINAPPINTAPGSDVSVSKSQVRFIANGAEADAVFGTPFGNAARNSLREYWTNTANVSIFKNIKIAERYMLQFHVTATNVFNHPNFSGIDPFIEDAGLTLNETGFANDQLYPGGNRTIYFGLKLVF
jgi:hypothetical protein